MSADQPREEIESENDRLDDAISEILGLHGAWVLTVEVYDPETGEPELHTIRRVPTLWGALGMVRVTLETLIEKARTPRGTDGL